MEPEKGAQHGESLLQPVAGEDERRYATCAAQRRVPPCGLWEREP